MFCKKCNNSIYMQALSTGTCILCGEATPSPHMPSHKVCDTCSDKHNLCQQCGEELNK